MKHLKRILTLFLALAMLLPLSAQLAPFTLFAAEDEKTLFSTSFEKGEDTDLLQSTLDGTTLSSVGKYTVGGTSVQNLATLILPETLSGSPDGFSGEGKINLFDGKSDTKYCIDQATIDSAHPITVVFSLSVPCHITSYAMVSANDSEPRDPKTFQLHASENGKDWILLDSQNGVTFSKRQEAKTFSLAANEQSYTYYRLTVTATRGEDYTTKGTRLFQLADLRLYGKAGEKEEDENEIIGTSPMASLRTAGPTSSDAAKTNQGFTGYAALGVYGEQLAKENTYARNLLFDSLSIKVGENTKLSYVIYPALATSAYDYGYTSHHLAIDLRFSDGSYLSSLSAKDQNGFLLDPVSQGESEALYTAQWNYIEADLSKVAKGKTVTAILVYFRMDETAQMSRFLTYFDDIRIENRSDPVYSDLAEYVNILRGTNNTKAVSRGITVPFVMRPNGFNGYTPANTTDEMMPYYYQESGNGLFLRHITVNHSASPWLPDANFGTWQMMANATLSLSDVNGIGDIDASSRVANYTHENEIAKAHYYSVTFEKDDANAPGVTMEITPTSHGAYTRFTYPDDAENVNLILGTDHGGRITVKTDPAFGKTVVAGYSDYHEKMYVYSVIDAVATGYEIYDRTAILSFAEGTKILTMALATSYISEEQAAKNLSLEIPADADFDSILREAREEWNAVLSTVEVKGASYTELVSLYSSLYRMHCYPYLFSENTGTNEAPVWQYRSPYTNKVADGKMYTTNGFWDTYRAYWPAMSLLSSERDAELLNGILLHYRDKGYIARWLGSAGVTCMMGTHSDIVLADAIIKGLPIDLEAALESMLKNAATANPDDTYGRAENATAPFIGYVPNTHENGLSWTLEDYINDWGIFTLCDHLLKSAKTEEDKARYKSLAAYYYNRCLSYADVFNTEVGYFMGKNERGAWTKTKAEFSPYTLDWYADYAETNAWNMAFAITYDIKGLAELYGGEEALLKKLTTFFSESREKNVYTGGYTYEQRETRLGLSMYNNQVSYHTAYLFSYLGKPSETQRLTREILSRLYVGSEIGQGYPGDEDNGAASAFYVLTALGLYEANIGSGEYLITSPLYQEYTLHLASGDITVKANHNSEENIYIQSCTVNGKAWELPYFTYEMLTSGDLTIVYEMGNTPSEFFAAEKDSLSSLSASKERENTVYRDLLAPTSRHLDREASYLTPTSLTVYTNGITSGKNLWDNNSKTQTVLQNGASVTVAFAKPTKLAFLTVTSASLKQNIASVTLETSKDGKTFTAETLTPTAAWNYYTEPYRIQENEAVYFLRLTFHGADSLALSELEIYGETDTGSTLPPVTDTPDVTDPPSTTQVPTTDETPSTSDPADTIDAPSSGRTVLIILGCVLLGAIGGIALFVLLRKKRNAA